MPEKRYSNHFLKQTVSKYTGKLVELTWPIAFAVLLAGLFAALLASLFAPTQLRAEGTSSVEDTAVKERPKDWEQYPILRSLSNTNPLYRQYMSEVNANNKRWARKQALLPVGFFVYQIRYKDSIFTISARTNVSVESIASLNRLEHARDLPVPLSYIILPNSSGLFLPEAGTKPSSNLPSWERKLQQKRDGKMLYHRIMVGKTPFRFYPRNQFTAAERRFFLENIFRSPVHNSFHITSGFGPRRDPITRKLSFHDGLDIRSAYGSPVYSVASGTVELVSQNRLYGLHVKIRLDSSRTKEVTEVLYGHLIAVLVEQGQSIHAGEVIGNSGNSGRTTGPHLHFSLFRNAKAIDPTPYFQRTR